MYNDSGLLCSCEEDLFCAGIELSPGTIVIIVVIVCIIAIIVVIV